MSEAAADPMPTLATPPDFAALTRLLDERIAAAREDRRARFRTLPMLTLAAVPTWTQTLAGGMRGTDLPWIAPPDLPGLVSEGLLQELRSPLREEQTDDLIRFILPAAVRAEIFEAHTRKTESLLDVWGHLRRVGWVIDKLATDQDIPDDTRQWVTLARVADGPRRLTDEIDGRVRAATDAPEIHRLIRAAREFDPFFRASGDLSLDVAMLRAARRLELLRRRDDDLAHLGNFLHRTEQLRALETLIGPDNEHWALHLIGAGGVGKTMLLRYITSQFSEGRLAVARVDFDYLNPEYPRLAPGLLLWAFAQDLRAYAPDGHIDSLLNEADAILDKLHEELRAGGASSAVGAAGSSIDHPMFEEALNCYVEAFRGLRRRVLLVLDTCEELARLRPDGTVPDSVRDTFHILERLHARMPELRVIFSGRRPLACRGFGWRLAAPSDLPERLFLGLHEIRGFTREETHRYLAGATVPEPLREPIWKRCRDDSRVVDLQWDDAASGPVDEARDNPYELRLYAEWAVAEPETLPDTILVSSDVQYVEFRIVRRLQHPELERLLPVIAVLGHIDEPTLRHLTDVDETRFEALHLKLRQQEWTAVRTVASGGDHEPRRIFTVEPGLRKRLREYAHQRRAEWIGLCARAAAFLETRTLEGDLGALDWTDFDAAINALAEGGDPHRAGSWWTRVESRFHARNDPKWTSEMLDLLCAPGGAVGERAVGGFEPAAGVARQLRPVVLAAYAEAMQQTGRITEATTDAEEESYTTLIGSANTVVPSVKMTISPLFRPDSSTVDRAEAPTEDSAALIFRLAASRVVSAPTDEAKIRELGDEIARSRPPNTLDRRTAETAFGALNTVLGYIEIARFQGTVPPGELVAEVLRAASELDGMLTGQRLQPDPASDLRPWAALLVGRTHLVNGDPATARGAFSRAGSFLEQGQKLESPGESDAVQRREKLLLDFACAAAGGLFPPADALASIDTILGTLPTRDDAEIPLDIERLRAVRLGLTASLTPLVANVVHDARDALTVPPRAGLTVTQRLTPPLYCVAAEVLAGAGLVDEAVAALRRQLTDTALHEEVRQELERTYLRVVIRFRLGEIGEGAVESLVRSHRLADDELRRTAGVLIDRLPPPLAEPPYETANAVSSNPLHSLGFRWSPELSDPTDTLHSTWRTFVCANSRMARFQAWRAAQSGAPDMAWECKLDGMEFDRMDGLPPPLGGMPLEFVDWLRMVPAPQAFAVATRARVLTGFDHEIIEGLREHLGARRAAEIMLEEAMFLQLRLPELAVPLATEAEAAFAKVGDPVGATRALLAAEIARGPSQPAGNTPRAAALKARWTGAERAITPLSPETAEKMVQDRSPTTPWATRHGWWPMVTRYLLVWNTSLPTPEQSAVETTLLLLRRGISHPPPPELRQWVTPGQPPVPSKPEIQFLEKNWQRFRLPVGIAVATALTIFLLGFGGWRVLLQSLDLRPDEAVYGGIGILWIAAIWLWRQWFVPRWLRRGLHATLCVVFMIFSFSVVAGIAAGVQRGNNAKDLVGYGILALLPIYGLYRFIYYRRKVLAARRPTVIAVSGSQIAPLGGEQDDTASKLEVKGLSSIFAPPGLRGDARPAEMVFTVAERSAADEYKKISLAFQPPLAPLFSRWNRRLGLLRALIEFAGEDPQAHGWPWEAVVAAAAVRHQSHFPRTASFDYVRSLPLESYARAGAAPPQEVRALRRRPIIVRRAPSVALEPHVKAWTQAAGKSLEGPPGSLDVVFCPAGKQCGPPQGAYILHAFGRAHEDSSGLRFLLGGAGDETPTATPAVALRAEDLRSELPDLALCILQGEPFASGRARGPADRRRAALTRRFAARLSALGVPAVLVVPPLEGKLALEVTSLLIAAVAAMRRTRLALPAAPPSRTPRLGTHLLTLVEEIRHRIAKMSQKSSELRVADFSDPGRVAKRLADAADPVMSSIASKFTANGRAELARWDTLPPETLRALLVNELNPLLRRSDAFALLGDERRNRRILNDLFPGDLADGRESAREEAWETALDTCLFIQRH